MFCSQLVTEAYPRAGVALVDGQRPNAVTPGMLHKGSKLGALEPAFEEIGAYDVPALNGDLGYVNSPSHVDLVISQEAVTAASKCLPEGHIASGNLIQLYELLCSLPSELGKAAAD